MDMVKPPAVVVQNCLRLPQFRTRIVITEEYGRTVVYRQAVTEEARSFLRLILDRERKNSVYLDGQFETLCGYLANDQIEYEYLPHESLLKHMAGHLGHRDWPRADALFRDYVDRLYRLPRTRAVPTEFLPMIAGETGGYRTELECLSRGLLDLTPRNILVDGSRWVAVDHEWSFDFPVPLVFILFRAVREAAILLQAQVRAVASRSVPVIAILGLGMRRLYVPVVWAELITRAPVSLSRMLQWELGFQRYARGAGCRTVGRTIAPASIRTHFWLPYRAVEGGVLGRVGRVATRLPVVRTATRYVKRKLYGHDAL